MGVLLALTRSSRICTARGRHGPTSARNCARAPGSRSAEEAYLDRLFAYPEPFLAVARLEPPLEARCAPICMRSAWSVPGLTPVPRVLTASPPRSRARGTVMALTLSASRSRCAQLVSCTAIWARRARQHRLRRGDRAHLLDRLRACLGLVLVSSPPISPTGCSRAWSWPTRSAGPYPVARSADRLDLSHRRGPVSLSWRCSSRGWARSIRLAPRFAANLARLTFMLPLARGTLQRGGRAIAGAPGMRVPRRRLAASRLRSPCAAVIGVCLYPVRHGIAGLYTVETDTRSVAAGLNRFCRRVSPVRLRCRRWWSCPARLQARGGADADLRAVALWGVGLGGGYVIGLTSVDLAWLGLATPLGAPGFWLAAIASLVLASSLVTAYFLRVSRAVVSN